jgi:hypothetical protein
LEPGFSSYIYSMIFVIDENSQEKTQNLRTARNIERYAIWPIFDLFSSLSFLYLFYRQAMKAIECSNGNKRKKKKG